MKFLLLFLTVLCLNLLAFHAAATTYYVDINSPDPTPPYASWSTAATNIQDAISETVNGDLILVNPGVYQSHGSLAPDGTLTVVDVTNAITIQGVAGETQTSINGSNTMRCVYLASGASLIGFTLTDGDAPLGGGVYCASSAGTIVSNCVLFSNFATNQGGGAYGAELNNCLIISNTAPEGGAGVDGGFLNNCSLIGNSNNAALNAVLTNCTLTRNAGGGAYRCTLDQCAILQNVARPSGGGGAYDSILNNCLIISNSVLLSGSGGGTYNCSLTNCILAYNVASSGGGAYGGTLVNCTVVTNTATFPGGGGGIFDSTAENCILDYNTNGDYSTGIFSVIYCCTSFQQGNLRNITNAPLFVNLAGGDYHLQSSSPCINSGNNAYITSATDLDGNPRVTGGTVDIGAYEYQTPVSQISYAWLEQYSLPIVAGIDTSDLDGTGFNVYQDWIAGLNPTNSASVLAMLTPVTTNTATGVTVTWQSVSGIPYFLQRSTNLASQLPFLTIQNNITGQTNTTSYTDTSATNSVPYFYRVGVVAP